MQMEKLTYLEERLGSVDELEQEINRVVTDNDQQRDQLEALTRTNLDIFASSRVGQGSARNPRAGTSYRC